MSHSKFSPSAAYRWLKCPLSIKMADLFPNIAGPAAEEGTRQHDVASTCLAKGTNSDEPNIQTYVDVVRKTHESFGGQLLIEHKVTIIKDTCYGTLDAGIVSPAFVGVYDYKSGTKPVPAFSNPQLQLYALGLLRENPLPKSKIITLSIVQPRTKTGWPVKRYTPTVETLMNFKGEVMQAIDKAQAPNPQGVAGSHCDYCPGKLHCPAYLREHGSKLAGNKITGMRNLI